MATRQQDNWPTFQWDPTTIETLEYEWARIAGSLIGSVRHLSKNEHDEVLVHILATEGVKTAEIEGEILNRSSVQSSIRRRLGLQATRSHIEPAEAGMAELMTTVYSEYEKALSQKDLHKWNEHILQGRTDLENKGLYRTHKEPMQIVSGGIGREKVHFVAPPQHR